MPKQQEKEKKPPPESVDDLKGWDKIKNQRIGHYLVVPTFWCSIIFYSWVTLVLLILGIAMLASAGSNADFKKRYDDICQSQVTAGNNWTFSFTLDTELTDPYVYYEVKNFYANHRKYVKSRSYPQLRGVKVSKSDVQENCDPVIKNSDVPVTTSYTGETLNNDSLAYPCGLIGKYRFTDRFSLTDSSSTAITIDSSDIAHGSDKNQKFENQDNSGKIQWLDFGNQHLMVWYQMESFPNFIKLYGKINGNLPIGTYTVTISSQWDTKQFKAEKSIYFSTVNGLGGKNLFLGIVFIIMSAVIMTIMGVIVILEYTKGSKAKHYSIDNLKW